MSAIEGCWQTKISLYLGTYFVHILIYFICKSQEHSLPLVIFCRDTIIISAKLIITVTKLCVISNDQIRSKNVFAYAIDRG